MFRIKLLALGVCLGIVGLVLMQNDQFRAFAENDAVLQIAEYKKWKRLNEKPIMVEIDESALAGG